MGDVRIISVAQADARYGVSRHFDLDHANGDDEVVCFVGDTALASLPLDFHSLDKWLELPKTGEDALSGVIVDGNLDVEGSVLNWESDFGPFLLVRGDLRAKDLGLGGSQVRIEGDLLAAQTLLGYYNHGYIEVTGDTRAQVIVTEQHLIRLHGAVSADLVVAGSFLQVAGPAAATAVGGWWGRVSDLTGADIGGLGTDSLKALRVLDPEFRHLNRTAMLEAIEAGRSLVRDPLAPLTLAIPNPATQADDIFNILLRAGCPESSCWEDGFSVVARDWPAEHGGAFVEVSFYTAEAEPEGLDPDEQVRRYLEALTAAGYQVTADPVEEHTLRVVAA
ncbi:hypothetical protein [Cryptosporangium minutisporangium]|uniref:Uncharacterized protein n=1 Tax=Cryptosporangium minutisporangium TaxID=113569 RepID=A0ABP6TB77_9ACTN